MAKAYCEKCWCELGFFSVKIPVSDGVFCENCLAIAGISSLRQTITVKQALGIINERGSLAGTFNATKTISSYLFIDEKNCLFKIDGGIYKYDELLSFELLEDGDSVVKGGLGRAVAGGLLFGGAGAIIGGVTAKKKTKNICKSMRIKVTLRDTAPCDLTYINFISTDTKVGGLIYNGIMQSAQECLSALQIIVDKAEMLRCSVSGSSTSTADEILKFKNLLDSGIITEDEFIAKKKQLLGI